MKILKIVLLTLLVLFGAYCAWMATLDGKYDVKRSTIINATPEVVFAEVGDFKTWPAWSSWYEKDTAMTLEYSDPSSGVGAWYSWKSETQGAGRMEILSVEPNSAITAKIEFDGMGSSTVTWTFKPVQGGTEVTWGMTGEMPFFFRIMTKQMDAGIGPDYEKGLEKLKNVLESRKPAYEFAEMDLQAMSIFYTHHEVAISALKKEWYEAEIAKITAYLGDDMRLVTGPYLQIYTLWDEENDKTIFDMAFPCASTKKGDATIKKGMSYAGKCIKTTHYGPYEKLGEAHEAMNEYLKANNLQMGDVVMEAYPVGPQQEKDPNNYMTEIFYSLKPM